MITENKKAYVFSKTLLEAYEVEGFDRVYFFLDENNELAIWFLDEIDYSELDIMFIIATKEQVDKINEIRPPFHRIKKFEAVLKKEPIEKLAELTKKIDELISKFDNSFKLQELEDITKEINEKEGERLKYFYSLFNDSNNFECKYKM